MRYVALAAVIWLSGASAGLSHAGAFTLPQDSNGLLGQVAQRTLRYEDTFARVAREEGVGYEALKRANPGVDDWIPGAGTVVVLPKAQLLPDAPREGIVMNLSELRLYFFDVDKQQVFVYPIGIGSEGRETPLMETQVVGKIHNPNWYPPVSVREQHASRGDFLPPMVLPGPENPLGEYAIKLARKGYFIHGTNQPIGVGRRVSAGCIRLYAQDIESLVKRVPSGTPVRVIRQPYKVAWHDNALYFEAHPREQEGSHSLTGFVEKIVQATETQPANIDWELAVKVAQAGSGLPVRISR